METRTEAGVVPGLTAQVDQGWRVDPDGRVETEDAPLLVKQTLDTEVLAGADAKADGLLTRAVRSGWDSGTACVGVAAFLFAFQAALVKVVSPHGIPVFEIVFVRSFLSWAFTLVTAFSRGIRPIYGQKRHWHLLAARGVIGAAAMTFFFFSLEKLPLADSISIIFCNPAICSIIAWLLLGERFGLLTALGCLASMGGVVLVAQPPFVFGSATEGHEGWTQERTIGMGYAILGALLTSCAYIVIRIIGRREPPLVLAMSFHTAGMVGTGIPPLFGKPSPAVMPSPLDCVWLLSIGLTSFAAQLLLNRGFQIEVAVKASAVNYTQVIYAHALGLLFFDEKVTWPGVLGAVLIAAGVVAVNSDKKATIAATKPSAIGTAAVPAPQVQYQQQQPAESRAGGSDGHGLATFVDWHGRLKAKPSMGQLLPFGLGNANAEGKVQGETNFLMPAGSSGVGSDGVRGRHVGQLEEGTGIGQDSGAGLLRGPGTQDPGVQILALHSLPGERQGSLDRLLP
ncbi:hypothetical protein N2152v2_010875 [Parachlorella kessleri]